MPRKSYPSDNMPRLSSLRLPAEIKAWIKKKAKENTRSQNGEVIHILQQAMENDTQSAH